MASLFVAWSLAASLLAQAKDPEDALSVFLSDLEKAVKNTNAKNLPDRAKLEAAARQSFDRELGASALAVPKPAWDYLAKHLDSLRLGDKKFPEDPFKAERSAWMAACKSVFTKEIRGAKEPETAPSTDQLFDSTFDAVRDVDKMFPLAQALRADGIASVRAIFSQLLPKTTSTTRDAKLLYTERIARIDKVFSVTSDKEKSANTESCTLLKALAKSVLDRDLPGGKK